MEPWFSSRVTVSVPSGGSAAPLRVLAVGRGGGVSVWHSLGETNAAQKREEEDYENKRKSRKSRVGKGRGQRKSCGRRMAREQVEASVTPLTGDPTRT